MMLRLILIRHAKSSWDDPFSDDHGRMLNKRGQDSAVAIGDWLAVNGYVPDVVLCSDATRTQETAALILPALTPAPDLQIAPVLYHAAPATLLDLLRKQIVGTVAVIGHNPGIGMLASALVAKAPAHPRFSDYPTCATTVIDFDIAQWSEAKPHLGTCVDFIVPRDLIGTTAYDIN